MVEMTESVKTQIILVLNFQNHQLHSEGNIWGQRSQNSASLMRVCDVHRSELTSEPLCEARTMKRQQESGDRDISRGKIWESAATEGWVQFRLQTLTLLHICENVTYSRACGTPSPRHTWLMHWIAFASTSSEVYGLLTWASVLFPQSRWNQGIEDGVQQVSTTTSVGTGHLPQLWPFKTSSFVKNDMFVLTCCLHLWKSFF